MFDNLTGMDGCIFSECTMKGHCRMCSVEKIEQWAAS